jgi:putative intracellular protease/amidase
MTRTVGIVLSPDVEELDFVGPLEALGAMAFIDRGYPQPPSLEVVHA